MSKLTLSLTFGLLLSSATLLADEALTKNTRKLADGEKPASAKLEDFRWLVGNWKGSGLGMQATESWTPPSAGTMVGTFRAMQSDQLVFSEFFMLSEVNGSLTLRLKHFDADFKSWEEKDKFVEFRFIRMKGRKAWFEGLTYEVDDDGKLRAYVALKQRDGSMKEGVFVFSRVHPAAKKNGEKKAVGKK